MFNFSSRWCVLMLLATLVAMSGADPAQAQQFQPLKDLAKRLPRDSNAFVAVDLKQLMESPIGQKEKWGEERVENWEQRPMLVPPEAQQVVLGALVDPQSVEPQWSVSVMRLSTSPSLESLGMALQAQPDKLWDREAIVLPNNAYLVKMDQDVLAGISPANRQFAVRWVRPKTEGEPAIQVSGYLLSVVQAMDGSTPVTMAMDLDGAVSPTKVKETLATNPPEKLVNAGEIPALAEAIASVRGVTLRVTATDRLTARGTIDFTRNVSDLDPYAKELFITALSNVGLELMDVANWNFKASADQVTFSGRISPESLRRLLNAMVSPIPADVQASPPIASAVPAASTEGPGPAAPMTPEQEMAARVAASQRYFKTVSSIIDGLEGGFPSMGAAAASLRRTSQRVNNLPILHVDPELVAWGNAVSTTMNNAAISMGMGQREVRVTALENRPYRGGNSWGGDYWGGYYDEGADLANARSNQQAAAQSARVGTQSEVADMVRKMSGSRMQIRAKMVERYKVEF